MEMKKAFVLFWQGITGILSGIANWFTVILGMQDNSKYGRFLRRVVGSCFALIMLFVASAACVGFLELINERFYDERLCFDDTSEYAQSLSRGITYYDGVYGKDGYVKDLNGEKTVTGIKWIAKPLGDDSLVCYSNGKKRGYFNMFTGKTVIKPQYEHAWIFSEGLASVVDHGWIKFINHSGQVVIDPMIPYFDGSDGYVFHNGYCVIHNNRRNRVGLIDKQGNWILKAEYFSIEPCDTFWIVSNGKEQSVLTRNLQTIIPFTAGKFWLYDGKFTAKMADHTMRSYNLHGEVIEDFYISNIENLTYDTSDLRYTSTKTYDENGNMIQETDNTESYFVEAVANCRRYEAEYGWYGLISREGKVLTPPVYTEIIAIDYDLYLCKDDENGVLLNGKGEKVKNPL